MTEFSILVELFQFKCNVLNQFVLMFLLLLCSTHLRAFPDRRLGLRGLRAGGLRCGRVLLPVSPSQTRAFIRRRLRRSIQQRPRPRDDPYDGQHRYVARLVLPPIEHGHLLQLFGSASRSTSRTRPTTTGPSLVLPAAGRKRLRKHAYQLLSAKLPASHSNSPSSRTVSTSSVYWIRSPCFSSSCLPRSHSSGLSPIAVSVPSANQRG